MKRFLNCFWEPICCYGFCMFLIDALIPWELVVFYSIFALIMAGILTYEIWHIRRPYEMSPPNIMDSWIIVLAVSFSIFGVFSGTKSSSFIVACVFMLLFVLGRILNVVTYKYNREESNIETI